MIYQYYGDGGSYRHSVSDDPKEPTILTIWVANPYFSCTVTLPRDSSLEEVEHIVEEDYELMDDELSNVVIAALREACKLQSRAVARAMGYADANGVIMGENGFYPIK